MRRCDVMARFRPSEAFARAESNVRIVNGRESDGAATNANPIVALAMRIKARRDVGDAIDSAVPPVRGDATADSAASLGAFGDALALGSKRLGAILGKDGITYVRLEGPLRVRLRFRERRVSLDLDAARELVVVRGLALDGDYQFDTGSDPPALVNLSQLSTDAGYGEPLTPARLLKAITEGAELPRPAHLDEGPMRF